MAAYELDESIRTRVEKIVQDTTMPSDDVQLLHTALETKIISVACLKIIDKYSVNSESIYSLIRGKKLVFPSFARPPTSESAELHKRRLYLQRKQEERKYNKMVYGSELSPAEQEVQSVSSQLSSVRNQMSIGLNMVVAIFATFGMVYFISGQFSDNTSTRMVYGLAGAVLVMIMEMVLFIMRAVRMEYVCEQGGGLKQQTAQRLEREAAAVDVTIDESDAETVSSVPKDKTV